MSTTQQSSSSATMAFVTSWEQQSKLTDEQNHQIQQLSQLFERPFPSHLLEVKEEYSDNFNQSFEEINSMERFYSWYSSLEDSIEKQEDKQYETYSHQLTTSISFCNELLKEINDSLNHLNQLKKEYELVTTKTGELNRACEELLQQHKQLVKFTESIQQDLAYFIELESLTTKMNNPNLSIFDSAFMTILKRLDECIAFIFQHPTYHEAKTYLIKFQQLQQKALTMIRNHILSSLRNSTIQILNEMKDPTKTNDPSFSIVKLRTLAPKIKPFCSEIESRAQTKEFAALLTDCQMVYCQQRYQILSPIVQTTFRSLQTSDDLSTLIRNGCTYLIRLCQSEYQLYLYFFNSMSITLRTLLEGFAMNLYDILRPMFVRSHDIDRLCEATYILKSEVLGDQALRQAESIQSIQPIITNMLEDIQERLIFLTQKFIIEDISTFQPTANDIDYPNKLTKIEPVSSSSNIRGIYATWYPTLEKSLMCLSKLYLSVDKKIFEVLAQETVSECTLSIIRASKTIQSKRSQRDGLLFLIKHLVILREQISPFDIEFSVIEKVIDFSAVKATDAISKVMRGEISVLSFNRSNGFLSLVNENSPRIVENQNLEKTLSETIEALIHLICDQLLENLNGFLSKTNIFISSTNAPKEDGSSRQHLNTQSFATAANVIIIITNTHQKLTSELPSIVDQIKLYLGAQSSTYFSIIGSIKERIVQQFGNLYEIISREYNTEELVSIGIESSDDLRNRFDRILSSNQIPISTAIIEAK